MNIKTTIEAINQMQPAWQRFETKFLGEKP